MDWQQVIALSVVTLSAGLLVWGRSKRRAGGPVCRSGCGCGGPGPTAPKVSVTYRSRKGERPQIITRLS